MLNWMRWLPENVSTYGGDIDAIIASIWSVTVAWFFLTFGVLGVFLWLYRRRPGRRAGYVPGESLRQAAWILVPVAVVLGLDLWIDFRGAPVWARVKLDQPPTDLVVEVQARQFNWDVVYPGPDGTFGTADDRQLLNEIHVPVGKPVRLVLKSRDVIHSLFSPHLRLKQDIVPGRTVSVWFEATRPGIYELPCAELCGFGHSGMKGWLHVHTPEAYRQWLKQQWPAA
ncbi:MAG TPA: cytochrome c oxidase subunit II [Candidatus Binatia bacterium]|nr:cytochrome c oxidase subunit II [Candidatus Binatia bacterium]